MRPRTGIFSGTFDPVHDGHILFAQTALEQMDLENIVFMPEKNPRRKEDAADVSFRAAMIEKAIAPYDKFSLKLARTDSHDAIDTFDELREVFSNDILLLMGADVFEYLPEWENHQRLIDSCGFIVALRTEDDGEIVIPLASEIGAQAEFLPSPLPSVSSSRIRRALMDNQLPKGLDDDVEDFIKQHNLYGT